MAKQRGPFSHICAENSHAIHPKMIACNGFDVEFLPGWHPKPQLATRDITMNQRPALAPNGHTDYSHQGCR